ncbi:MAG: 16S rRNA (guanine(527)-N(7))-methyltransferase RsmG [Phycisphaerae bacterium]|nr:16S rRNA (guanine(527)-N(7))-methyltransferase RsmG [Phycisphaerae bacterium]
MTVAELAQAGHVVSDAEHALLAQFIELLLRENEKLNLTAIRDVETAWAKHICDSLAVLPLIDALEARTIVDLGSGGGLPGVPIACLRPKLNVTLVDSTAKKVAAVERIVSELKLRNVRLIAERAEVLAHQPPHRERYDAVLARAVGTLDMLLEWASGFCKVEGQCWLYKSIEAAEVETERAETVAARCALDYDDTYVYTLPAGHGDRAIVIYSKVEPLPRDLPRPPWQAKKKPLSER